MTRQIESSVNRVVGGTRRRPLPCLLATVLTVLLAAVPAAGQDVQLEKTAASTLEINGGPADARWRIPYGTRTNFTATLHTNLAPDGHAYFTHGPWLRLIDVTQGRVVGRWRFPGAIEAISSAGTGGRIEVQFRVSGNAPKAIETAAFDPAAPRVPIWDSGGLLNYRLSEAEASGLALRRPQTTGFRTDEIALTPEQARAVIPDLEEALRRDALSPWLGVVLGKVLRDAGDGRAREVINRAVESGTPDFSELFRVSAFLEQIDEPQAAKIAFDRAYADYLDRRNDPRYMILIVRQILYSPFPTDLTQLSDARRRELVERVYELSPNGEFTEYAWRAYALQAEAAGRTEEARLWADRADATEAGSLFVFLRPFIQTQDKLVLVAVSGALGAVGLFVCLYVKYRPQRRLDVAAQSRGQRLRRLGLFNLDYWSRGERVSLLLVVAVGWYAIGLAVPYARVVVTQASMPVTPGSFANTEYPRYFDRLFPPSPHVDLLRAISYQQSGDAREAERRYRTLPQFAVSWNNLGVILDERGSTQEARAAFDRALQIDPNLQEAKLNTGAPATGFIASIHRRYRPGKPAIAIPDREHMLYAYIRGAWPKRYWRALLGPLPQFRDDRMFGAVEQTPLWRVAPVLVLTAIASLGLLLVLPYRDVTQPPGRGFHWCEYLFPGLSPVWTWFGPLAVVSWIGILLTTTLALQYGTPYTIFSAVTPAGRLRPFGLPETALTYLPQESPNVLILIGFGVLLLGANLFLIRRAGRLAQA